MPGRRGRGGGAAARAEAADESAAQSEAAPWRGPCAPAARACEYGGAGLEPPDALAAAHGAEAPSPAPPLLARAPPGSPVSGGQRAARLALRRDPGTPTLCTSGKRTRRPVEPAPGPWGSKGLRGATRGTYRTADGLRLRDRPAGSAPRVAGPRPRGGAPVGPAPQSTSGSAELGAPAEVACGPDLRSEPHERGAPGGLQQQRLGG